MAYIQDWTACSSKTTLKVKTWQNFFLCEYIKPFGNLNGRRSGEHKLSNGRATFHWLTLTFFGTPFEVRAHRSKNLGIISSRQSYLLPMMVTSNSLEAKECLRPHKNEVLSLLFLNSFFFQATSLSSMFEMSAAIFSPF